MQDSATSRERSTSPERDHDREGAEALHAEPLLRALSALLLTERDDEALARLVPPLRAMFDFDQAIALEPCEEFLQCIAATPDAPIGRHVAVSPMLTEIANGRVVLAALNEGWDGLRDLLDERGGYAPSSLFLPIDLRRRHLVLVILRAEGRAQFDASHD